MKRKENEQEGNEKNLLKDNGKWKNELLIKLKSF